MRDEEKESSRCGFPGGHTREAGGGWGVLNLRTVSIHRFCTLTASHSMQHHYPIPEDLWLPQIPKQPLSQTCLQNTQVPRSKLWQALQTHLHERVNNHDLSTRASKVCVSTQEFLESWSDLWLPGCPSCESTQSICKGPGSVSCSGYPGGSNGLSSPTLSRASVAAPVGL